MLVVLGELGKKIIKIGKKIKKLLIFMNIFLSLGMKGHYDKNDLSKISRNPHRM